jgi:hypothetical protein
VDDPFFAAHDPLRNAEQNSSFTVYLPDYEITALGCVEQYQFCFHGDVHFCTSWGGQQDSLIPLFEILLNLGDLDSAYDLTLFHLELVHTATVQRYLLARRGTQSLLSSQYRSNQLINFIDPKEQWVKEVTAWFETAFLQARYGEFHLLQRDRPPKDFPEEILALKKKFGETCNRILFFDGNYTNIDFIQLMILLSCLMVPWIISFRDPIDAGISRIQNLCWWIIRWLGVKIRAGAIYVASLVKTAYRREEPAPRRRFPYNQFWNRPENWRSHVELDSIDVPIGNTARQLFHSQFPTGYTTIWVSGYNLLCGIRALKESINASGLGCQALESDLLEIRRSAQITDFEQETGTEARLNINNFFIDQLGAILRIWGQQRSLDLQLGYILSDTRAFRAPAETTPTTQIIWISSSSSTGVDSSQIDHYEGIQGLNIGRSNDRDYDEDQSSPNLRDQLVPEDIAQL